MDFETIEHIGIGAAAIGSLLLLLRWGSRGIVIGSHVVEQVEGDGKEPGLQEWRGEVRDLLHQNIEEHRVLGRRLDEIQAELAHNGGMSVKDAVHRTERKLDDHLKAADLRQEATARHMLEIRRALESQGLVLPKEAPDA